MALALGKGLTVTVVVAVAVQLPIVPVIVYIVVVEGLAITLDPEAELNPVPGDQLNDEAPNALRVAVCCPIQILAELILSVGFVTTVTLVLPELTQPFTSVPVIVYCVVVVGLAFTVVPVEELKVAEGLHVYEFAPFAVNVAEPPLQIKPTLALMFGKEFTVTVVVPVALQVPSVAFIV